MTNDALLMPQPTPSFLRFGTQSVLIHVVGIAILNILQFSHTVEKPKPVVKVSLVKTQPQPKKVELEPPPMLQTQRQRRAVEPQRMMPSQQPVPLPERVQVAQVTPEPTRPQSPQPLKRRILQDSRASDTLKLKDFTKTARSHRPTTSTKTKTDGSAMAIPAFSTIATLRGISTKVSTLPASSRVGSSARRSRTLRSAPMSEGSLQTGVSLRRRTPLVYPRIARKEGWEGTVLLLVSVTPSGKPDEITVERTSGHEVLDKAAIDTVTRWTFFPAKDGNIPFHSIVKIPIKFSLTKQS